MGRRVLHGAGRECMVRDEATAPVSMATAAMQPHSPSRSARWLRAKLRLLRPIVETGFESVLLLRLCAEEALASGPAKRPLTIGEITANWGPELRETLLERYR